MTPADHANTAKTRTPNALGLVTLTKAEHAALVAQAETAEEETGKAYDQGFKDGIAENRSNREHAEARVTELEQRAEEMLADPVSWREQTFRLRMEAAEQRAADMEKALREIASTDFDEPSDFSELGRIARAALSAREDKR